MVDNVQEILSRCAIQALYPEQGGGRVAHPFVRHKLGQVGEVAVGSDQSAVLGAAG
jgi:hypothetical protein